MFMAHGMLMTAQSPFRGTPVAYDATGAGYMGNYNTVRTFSHTATAGAYVVLAFNNDRSTFIPTTVTYAGTPMIQLGYVYTDGSSSYGVVALYGLGGVSGGTSTVAITGITGGGWAVANTFSYLNVSSVGAVQSAFGQNDLLTSGLVSCGPGEMLFNAMGIGQVNWGATIGSPVGGTNRYLVNVTFGGSAMTVSDASSATTFSAAASKPIPWGSLALSLRP